MKTISESQVAEAMKTALPEITGAEIEELAKDRRILEHLSATHGWMLDSINGLLYKHDLEGIVFDGHFTQYEGEAAKILLKLPDCASADDVQRLIHTVMAKSFSGRISPFPDYAELAKDVFNLWNGTD